MKSKVNPRIVFVALVFGSVAQALMAGEDQQRPNTAPVATEKTTEPRSEASDTNADVRRTIYFARNAPVRGLVYLLEKHFEGHAGIKFVAEPKSNLLSIRANSDAALEEVVKTLAQIDRPQRQVALQMFLVEFNAKKGNEGDAAALKLPVDTTQLSGSAEEVLSQLRTWMTEGHVDAVRKYQLNALENTSATLFLGEQKPVPTSFLTNARTGLGTPVLNLRDFGTSISAIPRILETGEIEVQLSISTSQLAPPEFGMELGKGENGPIKVPETIISKLSTSLVVADGQSKMATGAQTGEKSSHIPMIWVVSARTIDPNKPPRTAAIEPARESAPANPPARTAVETRGADVPSGISPVLPGGRRSRRGTNTVSLIFELRNETFAKRVNLSVEQTQQINKLRDEGLLASRRVGSGESFLKALREIEQKSVDVLNDEQKNIWKEWQAERTNALKRETKSNEAPPTTRPQPPAPDRVPDASPRTFQTSMTPPRTRADRLAQRLAQADAELKENPNDPELLHDRASAHADLHHWDQAIDDLRSTIKAKPSRVDAILNLAVLLAYTRDEAGFRDCTRNLLKQATEPRFSSFAGQIADVCLLMPEWLDDRPHAEMLFKQSHELAVQGDSVGVGDISQMDIYQQVNCSRLELLSHQPLLAIQGLEELLGRMEASRFTHSSATQVNLYLAMALKSIGDDARAEAALVKGEENPDFRRGGFETAADQILLRQAQVKVLGQERVASTAE